MVWPRRSQGTSHLQKRRCTKDWVRASVVLWLGSRQEGLCRASQMAAILSVVDILGCSTSTARVLLVYFRWDTEALFGGLAERGDDWVYRAANVTSHSNESPVGAGAPQTPILLHVLRRNIDQTVIRRASILSLHIGNMPVGVKSIPNVKTPTC